MKNSSFRPSMKHICNLHFGKIYMSAKLLSEISVYDFNMADKQKFKGWYLANFSVQQFLEKMKMR